MATVQGIKSLLGQLDVNQTADYVAKLSKELVYLLQTLDEDNIPSYATLLQDVAGNTTLINQTETEISLLAQDVASNTSAIIVNANNIALKVSNNSIISAINLSPEAIKISSAKVDITGLVTFSNLTDGVTTISGSNIKTGTINANLITTGKLVALDMVGGKIKNSTETSEFGINTLGRFLMANTIENKGFAVDINVNGAYLKYRTGNDDYDFIRSINGYTYPQNIWNFSNATVQGLTAVFG